MFAIAVVMTPVKCGSGAATSCAALATSTERLRLALTGRSLRTVDEPSPSLREQEGQGCHPRCACSAWAALSWVAGAASDGRPE